MTKIINKKTGALSALSATLLLAVIMPSMPFTYADDVTICTGFLAPGTYENVVAPGPFCGIGAGVTVDGEVKQTGGNLFISFATVNESIQVEGGGITSIFAATVNGDIEVKGISGPGFEFVQILSSIIGGDVQIVESSLDSLVLGFQGFGNVINGEIKIFGNSATGGLSSFGISDNTVSNIECKENSGTGLPFVNFGTPNIVSGNTEDQCAGL